MVFYPKRKILDRMNTTVGIIFSGKNSKKSGLFLSVAGTFWRRFWPRRDASAWLVLHAHASRRTKRHRAATGPNRRDFPATPSPAPAVPGPRESPLHRAAACFARPSTRRRLRTLVRHVRLSKVPNAPGHIFPTIKAAFTQRCTKSP